MSCELAETDKMPSGLYGIKRLLMVMLEARKPQNLYGARLIVREMIDIAFYTIHFSFENINRQQIPCDTVLANCLDNKFYFQVGWM